MIKAIIQIIKSKRDVNGNVYLSAIYTDTKTGKAIGIREIDSINDVSPERLGLKYDEFHLYETEYSKREYKKKTIGFEYQHNLKKEFEEIIENNKK